MGVIVRDDIGRDDFVDPRRRPVPPGWPRPCPGSRRRHGTARNRSPGTSGRLGTSISSTSAIHQRSFPYLWSICRRPSCGSGASAWPRLHGRAGPPCARRRPARARACGSSPAGPRRGVPSSSAARTAQPGSPSWRQSLKRHRSAISMMSSKAVSTPSSAPATSSERMPGVSMSSAPPGSANSSRWVVVWRPRESSSRTVAVAWRCLAEQRVDERRLADARRPEHDRGRGPGRRYGSRSATWSPVSAESDDDRHAGRDRPRRRRAAPRCRGRCRPC